MSHELRTPLNSLLILAKLLAENPDGNLSDRRSSSPARSTARVGPPVADQRHPRPVEGRGRAAWTSTCQAVPLSSVLEFVRRTFDQVAQQADVTFTPSWARGPTCPVAVETDEQRLQQVLKNLLSNAFKFTAEGEVTLRIDVADPATTFNAEPLRQASHVLAFEVLDTGIGWRRTSCT
jgi:signal transduction histidine kinase